MDCGLVVETGDDGTPVRVFTLPMSDVRAGMQRRHRRLRHPGARARRSTRATRRSASWSPTSPRRSRRRCWSARSPTACARPRPPARRCCGSAARASCTPARRRRWWRWSTPASSTCCSPATPWPPTTSSPRSTAPASASTSRMGRGVEHGHEHHIRALNTIRKEGSIRAAVDSGVLTGGIMHALVTHDKEFVLVGSVRDDGPLPDVYTDVIEGQRAMRAELADVGFCLMVATMLHSVATGNILPGLDPAGLRRHQPGHGHQARRPRLLPGPRHRHRRRAVPRAARRSSSCPSTAAPDGTAQSVGARSAAPTAPASGPSAAASTGGTTRCPAPTSDRSQRRRGRARAAGRRRPTRRRRPRCGRGSNAATRLASPTPSQSPTDANAWRRDAGRRPPRRR